MTRKSLSQNPDRWFCYRRPRDESQPLECYVVRWLDAARGRWREQRLPRDTVTTEAEALRIGGKLVAEQRKASATEAPSPLPASPTFKVFSERWTNGTLAKDFPDYIKPKASVDDDKARLERYVYPHVGNEPLATFTINHAELVMRKLPAELSASTRRQVAQAMHRVLALSVYPARVIPSNPLPKGFLPRVSQRKAMAFLYPDEDRALLGYTDVPLAYRMFYGFLGREGMREGEALALCWYHGV